MLLSVMVHDKCLFVSTGRQRRRGSRGLYQCQTGLEQDQVTNVSCSLPSNLSHPKEYDFLAVVSVFVKFAFNAG